MPKHRDPAQVEDWSRRVEGYRNQGTSATRAYKIVAAEDGVSYVTVFRNLNPEYVRQENQRKLEYMARPEIKTAKREWKHHYDSDVAGMRDGFRLIAGHLSEITREVLSPEEEIEMPEFLIRLANPNYLQRYQEMMRAIIDNLPLERTASEGEKYRLKKS